MSTNFPDLDMYFNLFISGTSFIDLLTSRKIASFGTPFIRLESRITLSDCHFASFKFLRIVLVCFAVGALNSYFTLFT